MQVLHSFIDMFQLKYLTKLAYHSETGDQIEICSLILVLQLLHYVVNQQQHRDNDLKQLVILKQAHTKSNTYLSVNFRHRF